MKYQIQVNNGNANLGVTAKTITANEVTTTISTKFLAEEVHHDNPLIPVQVIESVLSNFGKTAARLMAEGIRIQLLDGQDVLISIYPDIHLQGGNINLSRAREILGNPQLTEAEMVEQAAELVSRVGVTYRARCEAEQKFTALLKKQDVGVQKVDGIKEVAFVPASSNGSSSSEGGNGSSEGSGSGSGDNGNSGNMEG